MSRQQRIFSNALHTGYTGDGVTIGLGDDGDIDFNHPTFDGADIVKLIDSNSKTNHAMYDAAIIVGQEVTNKTEGGSAQGARLLLDHQTSIVDNAPAYVQEYGMQITANPYRSGFNEELPQYSFHARHIDEICAQTPNCLHMYAAGNGSSKMGTGGSCAKNTLTVGNGYWGDKKWKWDTYDDNEKHRYSTSSRGLTSDGRVKPDLLVLGMGAGKMANPDGKYRELNGSSVAVSGAAALASHVLEGYADMLQMTEVPSPLLKGLLCNTADHLDYAYGRERKGPNGFSGFGVMNVERALNNMGNFHVEEMTVGRLYQHIVTPTLLGRSRVKVMLTWMDPPGDTTADTFIKNPMLFDVNGTLPYIPFPLPTPDIPDPASKGVNLVDNILQVELVMYPGQTFSATIDARHATSDQTVYLTWCAIQEC